MFSALPNLQFSLSAVVVGTVLALIGYLLGNFWDAVVFDPLYGPNGRWVGRSARPLGVFPLVTICSALAVRPLRSLFPMNLKAKASTAPLPNWRARARPNGSTLNNC